MVINCRGKLLDLSRPIIMGILNLSPDSFYSTNAFSSEKETLKQVEKMLHQGAAIIDIGAMSSRPGAEIITVEEELKRLLQMLESILTHFPRAIISVDTVHSKVAGESIAAGAHIINDISAGRYDTRMINTVAAAKAPFIVMHMRGMPRDMQENPVYENVLTEVFDFFKERIEACKAAGITDIVLDPGFGFGKTVQHNFTLLRNLKYFSHLNLPVLAGLSRKSLICKVLKVNPDKALNGTTALNMLALLNGANILRVHDVKEAMETVKLCEAYGQM